MGFVPVGGTLRPDSRVIEKIDLLKPNGSSRQILATFYTQMPAIDIKNLSILRNLADFVVAEKIVRVIYFNWGKFKQHTRNKFPASSIIWQSNSNGIWQLLLENLKGRGRQDLGLEGAGGANDITILLLVATKNSIVSMKDFWKSSLENFWEKSYRSYAHLYIQAKQPIAQQP